MYSRVEQQRLVKPEMRGGPIAAGAAASGIASELRFAFDFGEETYSSSLLMRWAKRVLMQKCRRCYIFCWKYYTPLLTLMQTLFTWTEC